MSELTNLLWLLAIGIPGWLVFQKLKLPGAPILGSMLAVGACQIAGWAPGELPVWLKPALQVLVGMFIGLRVTRDTRSQLRGMLPAAALVSVWWLMAAFATGFLLYAVTPLDLKTALLGSTPGGISEMGLLALHFGAHAPSVALLQFFRVTLVLVVVPVWGPRLYPWLERLSGRRAETAPGAPGTADGPGTSPGRQQRARESAAPWLYARTLAVAAAGGLVLEFVGFPAGGLVGAMLAVGVARMAGLDCAVFPDDLRSLAQVGLGGLIGLNFTAEMLRTFSSMLVPIITLSVAMLVFGFMLAVAVRRMTGWDIRTCVLATCAGGLTQITAVAGDMGAQPVTVTMLHVVRLITIVTVLPPVFAILFR